MQNYKTKDRTTDRHNNSNQNSFYALYQNSLDSRLPPTSDDDADGISEHRLAPYYIIAFYY